MDHPVDQWLALSDDELERQCKFEPYRSGGPGGQKRNKTSSAAKLTHLQSGISAHSNDFRSQSENRVRALHRLRFKLATELRTPVTVQFYEPPEWVSAARTAEKFTTNTKNPTYARLAAHVLDVFEVSGGNPANVAALLGVSTSHLIHFLKAEHTVWAAAARIRANHALSPLTTR